MAFDTAYAPRKKLFYFREVEKEIPISFQEEVIYRNQNLLVKPVKDSSQRWLFCSVFGFSCWLKRPENGECNHGYYEYNEG